MAEVVTKCPQCHSELRKCIIQQNFSIVICINEKCAYPFNEERVIDQLVPTTDKEIIEAAKSRLKEEEIIKMKDQ